ncbi:sortase domain-bontaining protein [Streptomyces sp. C10]|uniref:sortase domain-containing protein n=1 Tax=Streptomyces sp. C10 TaxID=531941 RepID=UPI00397FDA3B
MSADEDGRSGAVGVTARPGGSGPGGDVHGTSAVPRVSRGPGVSRPPGTHGTHKPLNTFALLGTHASPAPDTGTGPASAPDTGTSPASAPDTGTGPRPTPHTGAGPVRDTGPHRTPASRPGPAHRPGQLLAGVAWAVLLLGLWLWGRDLVDGVAAQLATTGDVAAAGRPLGRQAPPHAHAPVTAATSARPVRLTIDALGVRDAGIAGRGLDGDGMLTPPPYTSPEPVGWYAEGPQPGEVGAALLVARAGADRGPGAQRTVFHRLPRLKPGDRVDIQRADGSTARFTVEDIQLYDRHRFDPRKAYAAHDRSRSELRLITGDGSLGRDTGRPGGNAANVTVVSAYLTSYQHPPHAGAR